jgi:hypothetical protein
VFTDLHEIGEMFERLQGVAERWTGYVTGKRALYLPSQREQKARETREKRERKNARRAYVSGRDRKRELRAAARAEAVSAGRGVLERKLNRWGR